MSIDKVGDETKFEEIISPYDIALGALEPESYQYTPNSSGVDKGMRLDRSEFGKYLARKVRIKGKSSYEIVSKARSSEEIVDELDLETEDLVKHYEEWNRIMSEANKRSGKIVSQHEGDVSGSVTGVIKG